MLVVWIVDWSVINVAAVTVLPPLRDRPAAAAACRAELDEDSVDDCALAAAAPALAADAAAACCFCSAFAWA